MRGCVSNCSNYCNICNKETSRMVFFLKKNVKHMWSTCDSCTDCSLFTEQTRAGVQSKSWVGNLRPGAKHRLQGRNGELADLCTPPLVCSVNKLLSFLNIGHDGLDWWELKDHGFPTPIIKESPTTGLELYDGIRGYVHNNLSCARTITLKHFGNTFFLSKKSGHCS